jgi:hypothetical protein
MLGRLGQEAFSLEVALQQEFQPGTQGGIIAARLVQEGAPFLRIELLDRRLEELLLAVLLRIAHGLSLWTVHLSVRRFAAKTLNDLKKVHPARDDLSSA